MLARTLVYLYALFFGLSLLLADPTLPLVIGP